VPDRLALSCRRSAWRAVANSCRDLTDAFPAQQAGHGRASTNAPDLRAFVGLLSRPAVLAAWDWRLCSGERSVRLFGKGLGLPDLREIATTRRPDRLDRERPVSVVGLGVLLVAITYGIQPCTRAPDRVDQPWIITRLFGGRVLVVSAVVETTRSPRRCSKMSCQVRAFGGRQPGQPLGSIARGGLQFFWSLAVPGSWCRCTATTSRSPAVP